AMSIRFIGMVRAALFAIALSCAAVAAGAVRAQSPTPPPDQIDKLIELLSDPDVQAWLAPQDAKLPPPPPAHPAPNAMAPAERSSALDRIRDHMREMAAAIPTLPAQFDRAWTILGLEFEDEGVIGIIALILGLVAVGLGLVWVAFRYTQGYRNWMKAM